MERDSIEAADSILAHAEERHGGRRAFEAIDRISLGLTRLGGILPLAKGLERTFFKPTRVIVEPHVQVATLEFESEVIRFERGAIVTRSERVEHYRSTFDGLKKLRRWSNRDASYFFGYALVNYLSLPFCLEELPVRAAETRPDGTSWVEVSFPDGADTHSQVQRFWFDSTGRLIRHDYRADILGPMFFGAHFSSDYRNDLPIAIAQTRVVKARLGTFASPAVVLTATFESIAID